jgi:hypothetical protein
VTSSLDLLLANAPTESSDHLEYDLQDLANLVKIHSFFPCSTPALDLIRDIMVTTTSERLFRHAAFLLCRVIDFYPVEQIVTQTGPQFVVVVVDFAIRGSG